METSALTPVKVEYTYTIRIYDTPRRKILLETIVTKARPKVSAMVDYAQVRGFHLALEMVAPDGLTIGTR